MQKLLDGIFHVGNNGIGKCTVIYNNPSRLTGAPIALPNGTEDVAYVLKASDLLKGYSDADGDALSITSATTCKLYHTLDRDLYPMHYKTTLKTSEPWQTKGGA